MSIIVSLDKDCAPLKAFLRSSLRGKNPKKLQIEQFRYQQLLEGFSLQPFISFTLIPGKLHIIDIAGKHTQCLPTAKRGE